MTVDARETPRSLVDSHALFHAVPTAPPAGSSLTMWEAHVSSWTRAIDHRSLVQFLDAELQRNAFLVAVPRSSESVGAFARDPDVDVLVWREGGPWMVEANPCGIPILLVNGERFPDPHLLDEEEPVRETAEELAAIARAQAQHPARKGKLSPDDASLVVRARTVAAAIHRRRRMLQTLVRMLIERGAATLFVDPNAPFDPIDPASFSTRRGWTGELIESLAWRTAVRCERGVVPLRRFFAIEFVTVVADDDPAAPWDEEDDPGARDLDEPPLATSPAPSPTHRRSAPEDRHETLSRRAVDALPPRLARACDWEHALAFDPHTVEPDAPWKLRFGSHFPAPPTAALLVEGWAALARARIRVARLELWGCRLDADAFRTLCAAPELASLAYLELVKTGPLGDAFAAIHSSHFIQNMKFLSLHDVPLDDAAIEAVVRADALALESITLDGCDLGPAALASLAAAKLPHLARLSMTRNHVGDGGLQALAQGTGLRQLRELFLNTNQITDAGAIALAGATGFHALEVLFLSDNPIGDAGGIALAERFDAPRLETLFLRETAITNEARDRIRASRLGARRAQISFEQERYR